jgi:hypothetical protein
VEVDSHGEPKRLFRESVKYQWRVETMSTRGLHSSFMSHNINVEVLKLRSSGSCLCDHSEEENWCYIVSLYTET